MNKDLLKRKNIEQRLDYIRRWKLDNKKLTRMHSKKWRDEKGKQYRTENPDKLIEYSKLELERHPEKVKARESVHWAVQSGRIFKPESCEKCLQVAKLHGHHTDYSKPLEVNWLCQKCHTEKHLTLSM